MTANAFSDFAFQRKLCDERWWHCMALEIKSGDPAIVFAIFLGKRALIQGRSQATGPDDARMTVSPPHVYTARISCCALYTERGSIITYQRV